MSLLTPEKPTRRETPFHIYGNFAPVSVPSRQRPPVKPNQTPGRARGKAAAKTPQVQRHRHPLVSKLLLPALLLVIFMSLPVGRQAAWHWLGLDKPTVKTDPTPLPVRFSYISSVFGPRWGRLHQGVDFAAQAGTPIHAASPGKVLFSGWEPGYGKSVVIDHGNGVQTRYAHCSRLLVASGAVVEKGMPIAKVGSTGHSTGPHLHFEVIVKGIRRNPAWYYRFDKQPPPEQASLAQWLVTVPRFVSQWKWLISDEHSYFQPMTDVEE